MSIRNSLLITAFGLFHYSLSFAQELQVDVAAVRSIVSEWNAAHTSSEIETLSSLYSDTVSFYGSILPRQKCISIKQALLEKEEDFKQTLKNELVLSGYSTGVIRCDFVKTGSRKGKTVDYESYLIVRRFGERYLIIGESDLLTDRKIKNEPDLGTRVAIKNVESVVPSNASEERRDDGVQSSNRSLTEIVIGLLFAIGIIGLLTAWGMSRKPAAPKSLEPKPEWSEPVVVRQSQPASSQSTHIIKDPNSENIKKGLAFEQYVVFQFAMNKGYFTLLNWRGDKFYRGVFPKANQNPDLEYQYRYKDFVRKFSVECKYRSKTFNGSITLMDETKYRIYETFDRDEMPVYIALGLGGEPDRPEELFVIPFKEAKLEMPYQELSKYRSPRGFFYDMNIDRLI